jgi:hypothetical protein
MANPNPSPATRFTSGHQSRGGRPKGVRDRLSTAFLNALADDFAQHGAEVVAIVRQNDPSTYLRVYASIVPKEMELVQTTPESEMTDEQIAEAYAALSEELAARAARNRAAEKAAEASDPKTVN